MGNCAQPTNDAQKPQGLPQKKQAPSPQKVQRPDIHASASHGGPQSIILPIPPRLQWQNHNGYCGQTSIQSISLYYGNYISQIQARKVAGSEVLVGQNAEEALDKLSYEYQTWDNESPIPQYKNYLQWIKTNIKKGYPVILGGYDPQGNKEQQYDHIYLALGVKTINFDSYRDDDVLVYADLFDPDYTHTPFSKVWDSRQMKGNGQSLNFAIPRDRDYGIAVKGIKDSAKIFLPVRITLDENSQPNVSTDEQPVEFTLSITARELTSGKNYAILRYNSYEDIPNDKVKEQKAANVVKFEAEGSTYTFQDTVQSNQMAFYRCVAQEDLQ